MRRLRWPDSTNSVSEKPGTIQSVGRYVFVAERQKRRTSEADGLGLDARLVGRPLILEHSLDHQDRAHPVDRRAQRTSLHGFDMGTRYSNSTCSIRVSTSAFERIALIQRINFSRILENSRISIERLPPPPPRRPLARRPRQASRS